MALDVEKIQRAIAGETLLDEVSLRMELEGILDEQTRRAWTESPKLWMEDKLGEFLWTKQIDVAASVAANRKTAVPSCFASGKSWLAARLTSWWIDIHPPGSAFVVTTAPTFSQVKAILWKELGRAHMKGGLIGRLNQTEWLVRMPAGNEEMVAFGKKPSDMDATAFQGIHAEFVLVIIDEAAGVPTILFDAAESLIANEASRILAIGNPEDGASEFAKICKPGSGWNVIRIPAKSTPNFSKEEVPDKLHGVLISNVYVAEKAKKWGVDSPMYKAKIDAEFPDARADGLIPIKLIQAARERKLEFGQPSMLGVDVGGGSNKSVVAHRRGGVVRVVKRDQNPDTMGTCGMVVSLLESCHAEIANVDEVGIGQGLVNRAVELGKPVVGINVGIQAKDNEHFINLRAEGYWHLRELFETGDIDIDPDDEDLVAQLVELRYKRTSRGLIQIESKDEMKRRGVESPDDADAIMLAFLPSESAPRAASSFDVGWG